MRMCARFAQLSAAHRRAIAIAQGVCLVCLWGTVYDKEVCPDCGGQDVGMEKTSVDSDSHRKVGSDSAAVAIGSRREGPHFFECKMQLVLIKRNSLVGVVKGKSICISFDYEAEHSIVSSSLVKKEELETYPIDPVMIKLPIG
jgi:hypothetical protein